MQRWIVEKNQHVTFIDILTFFINEKALGVISLNFLVYTFSEIVKLFFFKTLCKFFTFDGFNLFRSLNQGTLVIKIVIFEISEADQNKVIWGGFNIFLRLKILEIECLVFLYGVKMDKFSRNLEFKKPSSRLGYLSKSIFVNNEVGAYIFRHRHADGALDVNLGAI